MPVPDEFPESLLQRALLDRDALFDARHEAAFRLFNGFSEGGDRAATLIIDLYGTTLLLHNYADPPKDGHALVSTAWRFLHARLPWIEAAVLKSRYGATPGERNGTLLFGTSATRKIREHGVWYAIDLSMNRDASFYLDTRGLRRWALHHLGGKSVLNTFAYTGSLGVAARAGGAARVVHLDKSRQFLNVAKTSYTLNGFAIDKQDFQVGDFWPQVNQLKRGGAGFDCVFLDPPFFSATAKGVVDLTENSSRLINKVRPLVNDGGCLVAINNALYLSGAEYMKTLESLCEGGYLEIEGLIPVPADFTGNAAWRITDPAPFNHSTKMAMLRVRRK